MADPLSIAASLLAISTAAIQSAKSLREAVKRYKGRDKTLGRLQDELDHLSKILESLTQTVATEESLLALLQGPIERCDQVCREFEAAMEGFSQKSKTGFRDWARMEFMRGDINEFIETIAGYKSTISVGLGTVTMQSSKISEGVLLKYTGMIKDTTYNLELHLQRIDDKITQPTTDRNAHAEIGIDLRDEREATKQCLQICEDLRSYFQNLSLGASSCLQDPPENVYEYQSFEAQTRMRQTIDEAQESFVQKSDHLSKRLASLLRGQASDSDRVKPIQDLKIEKVAPQVVDDTSISYLGSSSDETLQSLIDKAMNSSGEKITESSDVESAYAKSIFSEFSAASSLSSLGSLDMDNLTAGLARTLFCSPFISLLNNYALQDPKVGRDRLCRNIRKLIYSFGGSLKTEAVSSNEKTAARLLRSRRIMFSLALEIVNITENDSQKGSISESRELLGTSQPAPIKTSHKALSGEESDHSYTASESSLDNEGEDSGHTEINIQEIGSFLRKSQAYAQYKYQLASFVHGSYQQKMATAIGSVIISEDGNILDPDSVQAFAHEISWVPSNLLRISSHEHVGIFDHVKGLVEETMGETWDWWPLQPRKRPISRNFSRLRWRSPSGKPLHADLPNQAAFAVQETLRSAPPFILLPDSGLTSSSDEGKTSGATKGSTTDTNVKMASAIGASVNSPQDSAAKPKYDMPLRSSNKRRFVCEVDQSLTDRSHVYFCVKLGTSYRVSAIRTDLMETDVEFFSELKKAYLGNRGILRTCFSMWRYDHCEFFRFHKYGIDQSEPVRVDFPLDADLTYDFTPRPIDFRPPSGPIPKSQFHAHFYNPHSNNRTWRSFCLDRIAPELLKNEHLKSLPKRRQVIVQDSKREIFWGIYAREKRCFGWVLTYGVVCNFPGLLFFFLWIFEWQHASDLQNASVPVQLSLSLTICYAALLYESRERL